MPLEALPCVVCGRELESVDETVTNQPYRGTTFTTYGHYGSTIFDPMDGHYLELNLCDQCIERLGEEGKVLLGRSHKPVLSNLHDDVYEGVIGKVPVKRELVTWRRDLERVSEDLSLIVERDEIGSDLYPEIEYSPGILDELGPKT